MDGQREQNPGYQITYNKKGPHLVTIALLIAAAVFYIWSVRITIRGFYRDYKNDWHWGKALAVIVAALTTGFFWCWFGLAEELKLKAATNEKSVKNAHRAAQLLGGAAKFEKIERERDKIARLEARTKELEAELQL